MIEIAFSFYRLTLVCNAAKKQINQTKPNANITIIIYIYIYIYNIYIYIYIYLKL